MAGMCIRDKILETASRLFAEKGYAAVSMRRVATEVGMTPANLYYHFKDKEDLVRSSLAHVFQSKSHDFERIIRENVDAPIRCLERATSWFAATLVKDSIFARLLVRELLERDTKRLEFLTKNVFQAPFSILVHLIESSLDAEDPILDSLFLTSTLIGYVQFSGVIPYLRGARPEYSDPLKITQYLMREIRKHVKKEYADQE